MTQKVNFMGGKPISYKFLKLRWVTNVVLIACNLERNCTILSRVRKRKSVSMFCLINIVLINMTDILSEREAFVHLFGSCLITQSRANRFCGHWGHLHFRSHSDANALIDVFRAQKLHVCPDCK